MLWGLCLNINADSKSHFHQETGSSSFEKLWSIFLHVQLIPPFIFKLISSQEKKKGECAPYDKIYK